LLSALIWESLNRWPLAIGAAALSTLAIVVLYPAQVRSAGLWKGLPPFMRWVALVALSISVLKPVIQRPKTAEQWGAVLILVDCSKSMGIVDRSRTPAERVALAAALGQIPAGLRTDTTAALAVDLERLESRYRDVLGAQSDLDYARVAARGVADKRAHVQDAVARFAEAAHQLVARDTPAHGADELKQQFNLLENVPTPESRDAWVNDVRRTINRVQLAAQKSQSQSDAELYESNKDIRAACEALSRRSRLELAQDALLRPGTGVVAKLGEKIPVLGLAIGNDLRAVNLTEGGKPVASLPIAADGNESDLAGAVTAAIGRLGRQPIRAVVLLSDGRQVGGRGDVISALRPSGVPVFAVGTAAERTPDVSITDVTLSSQMAFAGEVIEGEVDVSESGDVKPPSELHVTAGSLEQTYHLAPHTRRDRRGPGRDWRTHFSVPMTPEGSHPAERLVFSVPASADEVTAANNRAERWIKVSSDKLHVAICTAAPTWDFQYLRSALDSRPWVELDPHILDPDHPALRMTPAQILNQDVLLLDDVPANGLDVNQWDAVHTLVTTRGGSVIFVAGTAFPISDYVAQPLARTLLPFHDVRPTWKEWPGEQPAFHFVPTPLGAQEALRLGDGPEGGLRRWQELPGVYRYLQIPDKGFYPDVQRLLQEADGGNAVLTERRIGAGRVIFLGLNETWRWRVHGGEQDLDRFWRQLVRHAAGEPYLVTRGPVSLDVDRVATRPGVPVRFRARVRGLRPRVDRATSWPLYVLRDGKAISTRQLAGLGGGRFAGQIGDLPEGDYEFELRGVIENGSAPAVRVPLHVAESDEAEMRDVSGDVAMLTRIARSSGGQYLPIEQVDQLADRLNAMRETESQFARQPLWDSPYLFAFVLACLAGEWALRKRLGLA
jgi:hypothetical protein